MHEKTLREHLAEISRARWSKASEEEKRKHGQIMAEARWGKKVNPDVAE